MSHGSPGHPAPRGEYGSTYAARGYVPYHGTAPTAGHASTAGHPPYFGYAPYGYPAPPAPGAHYPPPSAPGMPRYPPPSYPYPSARPPAPPAPGSTLVGASRAEPRSGARATSDEGDDGTPLGVRSLLGALPEAEAPLVRASSSSSTAVAASATSSTPASAPMSRSSSTTHVGTRFGASGTASSSFAWGSGRRVPPIVEEPTEPPPPPPPAPRGYYPTYVSHHYSAGAAPRPMPSFPPYYYGSPAAGAPGAAPAAGEARIDPRLQAAAHAYQMGVHMGASQHYQASAARHAELAANAMRAAGSIASDSGSDTSGASSVPRASDPGAGVKSSPLAPVSASWARGASGSAAAGAGAGAGAGSSSGAGTGASSTTAGRAAVRLPSSAASEDSDLSQEDRARARNRIHARKSRMRKKMFVQQMKASLRALRAEEAALSAVGRDVFGSRFSDVLQAASVDAAGDASSAARAAQAEREDAELAEADRRWSEARDPEERQARRRERNRLHARKSRALKKEVTDELRAQLLGAASTNANLRAALSVELGDRHPSLTSIEKVAPALTAPTISDDLVGGGTGDAGDAGSVTGSSVASSEQSSVTGALGGGSASSRSVHGVRDARPHSSPVSTMSSSLADPGAADSPRGYADSVSTETDGQSLRSDQGAAAVPAHPSPYGHLGHAYMYPPAHPHAYAPVHAHAHAHAHPAMPHVGHGPGYAYAAGMGHASHAASNVGNGHGHGEGEGAGAGAGASSSGSASALAAMATRRREQTGDDGGYDKAKRPRNATETEV